MPYPRTSFLALLLLAPFVLVACDSDDDDDDDFGAVAGIYQFEEFRFTPARSGVAPADVLARLDASETQLRLFRNGEFTLQFDFSGTFGLITGTYTVTDERVTLRLSGDDEDEAERILLGNEVRLQRSPTNPGVLTASNQTSVNLSNFDDTAYPDADVDGTLTIRLRR